MNVHLNLNLKQMGDMIYEQDPTRIQEEEEDIVVEGVSRSMLASSQTFSEEEDLSSCSMCSSSDLTEEDDDDEDAVSSSSSNGPLEDLSDLMSHLPIKRGLSNFYEGKSQSFTSLANVQSLEDLMKRGFKNRKYGAARKLSRSTGGIIDQSSYKRVYNPKATICKKPTKTLSCLSRRRH